MAYRAQYEIKDTLFEGVPATCLFPWAGDGKAGTGMILKGWGMGGTYFLKKLSEEIPSKIYFLDGNSEYAVLEESNADADPKIIAVDDIYPLLRDMNGRNSSHDEAEVLQILKNMYAEAKGKKLIFVTDEPACGMHSFFQDSKNAKDFLKILDGCVATNDDVVLFQKILGKSYVNPYPPGLHDLFDRKINSDEICQSGVNVYKFRETIRNELSVKMRAQLRIRDIPLVVLPKLLTYNRESKPQRERINEDHNAWYGARLVVSKNEPEKIVTKSGEHVWSPSRSEDKWGGVFSELRGQQIIAPIRALKLLAEELGEISRKTLDISGFIGKREKDKTAYGLNHIKTVSGHVKDAYSLYSALL